MILISLIGWVNIIKSLYFYQQKNNLKKKDNFAK